MLQSLNNKQIS